MLQALVCGRVISIQRVCKRVIQITHKQRTHVNTLPVYSCSQLACVTYCHFQPSNSEHGKVHLPHALETIQLYIPKSDSYYKLAYCLHLPLSYTVQLASASHHGSLDLLLTGAKSLAKQKSRRYDIRRQCVGLAFFGRASQRMRSCHKNFLALSSVLLLPSLIAIPSFLCLASVAVTIQLLWCCCGHELWMLSEVGVDASRFQTGTYKDRVHTKIVFFQTGHSTPMRRTIPRSLPQGLLQDCQQSKPQHCTNIRQGNWPEDATRDSSWY